MSDILMRPFVALQVAVHELREREDGQTTTEYAILLGFLAIAIIVALFFLKDVLKQLFSDAANSVSERTWWTVRKRCRPSEPATATSEACAGVARTEATPAHCLSESPT